MVMQRKFDNRQYKLVMFYLLIELIIFCTANFLTLAIPFTCLYFVFRKKNFFLLK